MEDKSFASPLGGGRGGTELSSEGVGGGVGGVGGVLDVIEIRMAGPDSAAAAVVPLPEHLQKLGRLQRLTVSQPDQPTRQSYRMREREPKETCKNVIK